MSEENQSQDEAKSKAHSELLNLAKKRFDQASDVERESRALALDDLKFRAGEQWPDAVKQQRQEDSRPCLTINRLPQFVRQITNEQRQNRPSMKVSPVDDKADIETAKIMQGMLKHIENDSNADVAYDNAFAGAVVKGFGFFRITTEYVSPLSFEQEIKIKQIPNHFNVYLDPSAKEPDGSDANWGFVFEELSKEEFKAQYPKASISEMSDWKSIGDQSGWVTESMCRVAEYYYKDFKLVEIVLFSDGSIFERDQIPDDIPEGVTEVNKRMSLIPTVKHCKINGEEVLEESIWPSKWIPIIPVYGEELDVDGKRITEGIVRHAKDPQTMYNYWASSETEAIALAPKAPFLVAEDQIPKAYEQMWKTANVKNHPYLVYKPTAIAGQPVGAPQRNAYEPPVMAITNARAQSADDLKATTGIYDAALGNRSNENSGVAIQRRANQSQTSNFHFIDNLSRSIKHGGRICIDIMPKIYDTERVVRTIGEDGQQEIVHINQIFEKGGQEVSYNLGAGKYDLIVETGPSYATKRQEAAAAMIDMSKAYPKVAEVAGDLIVKNMDWPGAQEISDRLKKTLAPGLVEDKDKPQIPQEIQAQMSQMQQVLQQQGAALDEAQKALENKTLELESKERIEFAKLEQNTVVELAKINHKATETLFSAELAKINNRLQLLDVNQPIESDLNDSDGNSAVLDQQQTGGIPPNNGVM